MLELSGIGDPKILSGLGIETKVDLPAVGTNVQDHLFAGVAYGALPLRCSRCSRRMLTMASTELKEPEKFNTIDPLLDPAVAEQQVKL